MRPEHAIDAYRPVIEPVQKYLYGSNGNQPGDPHKAALAILQVVDSDNPPLRLLLGEDAIGLFEKKQQRFQDELARWQHISEDTAFDGVTISPVGG